MSDAGLSDDHVATRTPPRDTVEEHALGDEDDMNINEDDDDLFGDGGDADEQEEEQELEHQPEHQPEEEDDDGDEQALA